MLDTIIGALLPIIVTLLLGMLAGWHKDFSTDQASLLNRMVMLYALPLSLFSSMMQISRQELLSDGYLFALVTIAMIGGFLLAFLMAWKVFKRDMGTAALQGLAIGGPAVPFVGVPVLGYLFGVQSAVAIAIAGILMNLIQVPICLVVLSMAKAAKGSAVVTGPKLGLGDHILSALREPVVWAPFLALVLIILGVTLPKALNDSFSLLGKATGGVALFASGVVLFAQRVKLNLPVMVSVLCRNIGIPLFVFLLAYFIKAPQQQTMEAVLSMAIPVASITVILAVQYQTAESEMASTLFISTIFSVLTMAGFIWLVQ